MNTPVLVPLRTSSLAIASLICGVLCWCVLPLVGAVAAVVCGHLARSEIRHAPPHAPLDGNGLATAGLVLGYLNLLAGVLVVLTLIGALFLGAGLLHWWH